MKVVGYKNINLLTKQQYDSIENPDDEELWAVEVVTIVETYSNGSSWYRVYSDGWCEQGGYKAVGDDANVTVTLLKSFINTNYTVLFGNRSSTYTASTFALPTCISKQTGTFHIGGQSNGGNSNTDWMACGYIK